jgi:hypothetical protein
MANANEPHARVIAIIEEYLRDAGLFEIIAEHRRPHVLRWPETVTENAFWILVWLLIFWFPEVCVVLSSKGRSAMMFAFIAPPATLAGYGLALTILLSVLMLTNRVPSVFPRHLGADDPTSTDWEKQTERAAMIAVLALVFGTPLVLAVVDISVLTAPMAALYFGINLALTLLIMLLVAIKDVVLFRLYVVKGFVSMTGQIMREILRHLPFIASVLLVIVLFSIFSTEFWEALGNLKTFNLFVCIALLIALPLIFALSSINREAKETLKLDYHEDFLQQEIIAPAEQNSFIREALDDDRLQTEDWEEAKTELRWRTASKLYENIYPILSKHAIWWLRVLLTWTVFFLFVAFFVYFLFLFYFLIEPATLNKWLRGGQATTVDMITITVPLINWQHQWPSTIQPMAKVSLLLSSFIAMMSTVHILSDGSVKQRFTEHLSEQARSWKALSCIYRNLISPGYQFWSTPIRKKGLASVSIVVSSPADLNRVKSACVNVRSHLEKERALVVVTAFEHLEQETAYSYGMQANCWQMIFEPEADGMDPIQVFKLPQPEALADNALLKKRPSNNGFRDNTQLARKLAQTLERRIGAGQHVYVFEGNRFVNVVIRGEKLAYRRDYLNLMQTSIYAFTNGGFTQPTISVYVYNHNTQEELAFLLFSQRLEFVVYRDSLDDKIRIRKTRKLFPASA